MVIKNGMIFGIFCIILSLIFSGCFGVSGITVTKIDYEPESYINITIEQMGEYPKIKECITIINSDDYNKTVKSLRCTKEEQNKIEILFGEDPNDNVVKGDNFFKYQDEYYSLGYYST